MRFIITIKFKSGYVEMMNYPDEEALFDSEDPIEWKDGLLCVKEEGISYVFPIDQILKITQEDTLFT